MYWFQVWPAGGVTCISSNFDHHAATCMNSNFGHQVASLHALVTSLATIAILSMIALLTSLVGIELLFSSARVNSFHFHKHVDP